MPQGQAPRGRHQGSAKSVMDVHQSMLSFKAAQRLVGFYGNPRQEKMATLGIPLGGYGHAADTSKIKGSSFQGGARDSRLLPSDAATGERVRPDTSPQVGMTVRRCRGSLLMPSGRLQSCRH